MSVLLSPSACAAGMPSTVPAPTTIIAGRVNGQYCMSISFLSAAWRRPVVHCGVSRLPDHRWAEFVARLTDQIRGLVFIGGKEISLPSPHDLCIAAARRDLVADDMSVAQGLVSVGDVVAGPHMHVDQIGHNTGAEPGGGPQRRGTKQRHTCENRAHQRLAQCATT